jgi:hypothetical protein
VGLILETAEVCVEYGDELIEWDGWCGRGLCDRGCREAERQCPGQERRVRDGEPM